jgi:hypothetical protein
VAEELAEKFGYPLPDRHNLARVAQFMAIQDAPGLRTNYMELLQQRVLEIQENEIHHLLADLGLPLYVTTNADSLMVEALTRKGLQPRRIGPRWQPKVGAKRWTLLPEPSAESPVVLHLNGYDGDAEQQQHLVLSEDDYLAHVVRLYRDQQTILPINVLSIIPQHRLLFLGYDVNDWEFRVLVQGLLRPLPHERRHVGVQLEVGQGPDADQIVGYLQDYLNQFDIDIYWGTPQQFASELHARWQEYPGGKRP